MSSRVAHMIRQMAGLHWLMLFAGILLCWLALFFMSAPQELRTLSAIYGTDFWVALCTMTPDAVGALKMILMWSLMSAAMMAPTALPAFATYDDLGHADDRINFPALVGGYLIVWVGFSVFAALIQMALLRANMVTVFGDSRSAILNGVLLLIAGGYQFTNLKHACLSKCRRPLVFFMQHWEEGPFRNGLRLGLVCLGCCWALMLLGFVGGVMNLGFMALATVLMVIEKLPDIGRWVTTPLGVVLIAAGLWQFVNII